MNSRKDLIKMILYYSNEYTREELDKIADEELVYMKIKAERNNPALRTGAFQKHIGSRRPGVAAKSKFRKKKKK